MKQEFVNSLNEECENIIQSLGQMDCSSEEYAEAIKNLNELRKIMIDEKLQDHRIAIEDFECDIKAKEKKFRVLDIIVTTVVSAATIAAGLYKHNDGMKRYEQLFYDGLKFEEEGVIGSNMVKNHLNQDKITNITK